MFQTPGDETPLWRYTDMAKFVSLLSSRSLFFARADKLGDPFEGSLPRATRRDFVAWMRTLERPATAPPIEGTIASFMDHLRHMTRYTLINSWFRAEHESDAMWRLYGGATGVAVHTTVGSLKNSLGTDRSVYIGSISYVDYDTAVIPMGNAFWPYLHKRLAFQHEQEVRAVVVEFPPSVGDRFDYSVDVCEVGTRVPVDLGVLVAGIAVAPYAHDWFHEVVQDLVTHYDLDVEVRKSDIGQPPEW